MARVVVLNGAGSAGKSSIARALQTVAAEPIIHVAMDAFLDMLPEALHDHPAGYRFVRASEDGKPSVAIETGPIGRRLLAGMRRAVAAMAGQGLDLVVDDVVLDGGLAEYAALLAGHDVRFVGVFAPLEVLEERERMRGDRAIGLARWQYGRVHLGARYDLTVDTGRLSAGACAALIRERFAL